MYKSYYKLTRNPFELTPDPTCFVPTMQHNEALAALYYGIRRHKGVVVVTGEVGTGKTLLLRCLLQLFKQSSEISYAYLYNCRLTPLEFLHYTVSDLGLPASEESKSKLILELSRYVTSRGLKGLTTVLIVDEAHNLSTELIEEIRLLSNLETNDDKLLQIVLVGQPELDQKLDSFELRPMKQRIALRAHLNTLTPEETEKYILERLTIAGADARGNEIFSPNTIKAIHSLSRGTPRLINTICENALITGYAKQLTTITPDVVGEVARDFHLNSNGWVLSRGLQDLKEKELERPEKLFADRYSSTQSDPEASSPIILKAGKHEPDI